MNLSRLQRFLVFDKPTILKILWTGFLFIGILSFCLSQQASFFADELKKAGTTESEKKAKIYYTTLRSLQLKYQSHLESNCNDKADLYRNIGIHFYNNDDEVTALQYIQDTALQVALNCSDIDDELLTQIYLNILGSKLVLDQKESIPPIIEKLKWHLEENKAGSILHQAKIQKQISRYYRWEGDYDESILWIRSSIANHNKLPLSETKLRAYLEMGYILYGMEDYKKAIIMFDSTRLQAQELNLLGDSDYNETLIYNKAVCYEELGELEQAIHFNEVYASMTDPYDLIVRSDIANLKSYLSFGRRNYKLALNQIQESIELSIESNDEYQLLGLVDDYLFKSNIYLELEQFNEAGKAALKAMERAVVSNENWEDQIFDFSNLFIKNPNDFNKAATNFFKAIIHYESEEKIISLADQLDSTFFSLQTYFSGDESKSDVTSRHHDFCDELLNYIFDNKLENKYPQLTSYYISTSKSLSLFEKLSVKQGIPEELRPEFNDLNKQWNDIYSELEVQETLGNAVKIDSLAQLNFQLSLRRDRLNEKLAALNLIPDFRKLRSGMIEEMQSKLNKGESIVDFFYGNENIYSWCINANQIAFYSDKIHPILEQDFIPNFSSLESKYLQSYDEKVDSLSNYFAPFFPDAKNSSRALTIIPDGRLLYFPFEILEMNNQSLLEQSNIHYLFSYSISKFNRNTTKENVSSYVGFAMEYDEDFLEEVNQSQEIFELYQDQFSLSKLPFAIEEIKQAEKIFSGRSFLDAACTRETFFKEAENCQVLHIANHALLNEHNSYLSSILLAKDGQVDMINAIDIKKLNLNADLAILSSCNSGRGENIKGSGLRSLGLSFAEAGCPAILVNLWEASDKSTKQIIEKFSNYLKDGMSKSLALQKAKLDYLKNVPRELQHPKYWANIVLIGDSAPIEIKSSGLPNWITYLSIILVLLLGGIIGKKYLKPTSAK